MKKRTAIQIAYNIAVWLHEYLSEFPEDEWLEIHEDWDVNFFTNIGMNRLGNECEQCNATVYRNRYNEKGFKDTQYSEPIRVWTAPTRKYNTKGETK